MSSGSASHDCGTAPHDQNATASAGAVAVAERPPDTLSAALNRLHLEGAVFLRAEYRENWAYESLTGPATAALLRPGTSRVILFHLVASGTCWVRVDGGEKHWTRNGDVIVLPYGDQHQMGGVGDAEAVPIMSILEAPPWTHMPVIRHGHGGDQTDVVCGYLHSQDPLFDPRLRVFPPVFVVHPPAGPAATWVRANIEYARQETEPAPSAATAVSTRLPELLLIEVLRIHLATAPAVDEGWMSALRDPVLAPALALLHQAPEHKWTVTELARASAVSRSFLDERFRKVLGRSPIRYLTEWRMHVAEDLLATTGLGVYAVDRRVGYDAEEAFSRAFKRSHGSSPSVWRAGHAH